MRCIYVDTINCMNKSSIEGSKFLSLNEDIFRDHFPNSPMLPAALMIEASIQLGRIFIWESFQYKYTFIPSSFDNFKFFDIITPGHILNLLLVMNKGEGVKYQPDGMMKMKVTGTSDNRKIFQGTITAALIEFKKLHDEKKCRDYVDFLLKNMK